MEIVRCSKGHFYDSEENSTCPMCAAESSGGHRTPANILETSFFVSDSVPTEGTPNVTVAAGTPNVTAAAGTQQGKVQQYAPTIGVGFDNGAPAAFDKTGARVQDYAKTTPIPVGNAHVANENKPVVQAPAVFNPVVGWLVCMEGPSKGKDYRIHNQYNFIGRGEHMDICIPEDPHISSDKSAVIAYDDLERAFFFGPGNGHNAVRVNDKLIINTTMIQPYDVLTVGKTKLLFVPLCGDRFTW